MTATLVVLLCAGLNADASAVLEQARQTFSQGLQARTAGRRGKEHFSQTVAALQTLRQRGYQGPGLFLSLGNAQWLNEDLPGAILSYRQGLRLYPSDGRLREALISAREHVVYTEGNSLGRPNEADPALAGPRWAPGLLFVWLILGHTLGCILAIRWWMRRRLVYLVLAAAGWSLAAVVISQLSQREDGRPIVVLAKDNVLLRQGNGENFPAWSAVPLHRGVEARLCYRRSKWLQIELADGEVGWIRASEALVEQCESTNE